MNNVSEFFLKLKDMLSPSMRAAARLSDTSSNRINRALQSVSKAGREMGASINQAKKRLDELNNIRLNTRNIDVLRATTNEVRKLERQIEKVENRGSRSGGLLGGLFGGGSGGGLLGGLGRKVMLPAAIAGGLLLGGKSAISASMDMEDTRTRFGVMTGSPFAGNKMVGDIKHLADHTPFESKTLFDAGQTMMQFGVENEKVLPTLRMLGDVTGGNAERMKHLTLAYSQMTAAGRLMGQDLLQMVQSGFNPLKVISDQTGISMLALKGKMEDGAISSKMVEEAFRSATGPGGQFFGMMDKMSQTLSGRLSTLRDGVRTLAVNIGDSLKPAVSGVVDWFGRLVGKVNSWFQIPLEKKVHNEIIQIRSLGIQLSQTNITTERRRDLLKQLEQINPNITKGIKAEAFEYAKLAENIDKVTSALKTKLVAQKLEDLQSDVEKKFKGKQMQLIEADVRVSHAMANIQNKFPELYKNSQMDGQGLSVNASLLYAAMQKQYVQGVPGAKGGYRGGGLNPVDQDNIAKWVSDLNEYNRSVTRINTDLDKIKPEMDIKMEANRKFLEQHKSELDLLAPPATGGATPPKTVDPNSPFAALGDGSGGKKGRKGRQRDDMDKTADAITGGGSRVITINVSKMVEALNINTTNLKEGAAEVEQKLKEMFLRVLYSANEIPGG